MAESGKAVHSSRNAEKRKAETLRRDILVLIYQFLLEEGFQVRYRHVHSCPNMSKHV